VLFKTVDNYDVKLLPYSVDISIHSSSSKFLLSEWCEISENCPGGCLNGGTCVASAICRCTPEYEGPNCQYRYYFTMSGL